MKPMKHFSKKNDAVSPVVGVMLMLVVTIIIAAVVAVFASGLVTTQEPAENTIIKLDDYKTGSLNYTGDYTDPNNPVYTYTAGSFVNGFDSGKGAFGIYEMVFTHNGGNTLNIKDLTLSITINGSTFETPLTDTRVYSGTSSTFSAGDRLKITIATTEANLTTLKDGLLFGLGKQDIYMYGYGKPEFSWALKDKNNNVIAKGSIDGYWW